jgi:hypothetical protein
MLKRGIRGKSLYLNKRVKLVNNPNYNYYIPNIKVVNYLLISN